MSNEKNKKQPESHIPRLRDLSQMAMVSKMKPGPTLFGGAPASAPLGLQAIEEQAAQAARRLPLSEAEKERVKNLVLHFASLVGNQVDAELVKGLAQVFVKGIIEVPGFKPEEPSPLKGRGLPI